jgi:cell wall-associated NlpC family hydrolase
MSTVSYDAPGMAGQIDAYLKKRGSPLAGQGKTFVAAGRRYKVDPRLVVSISGIESSFGKHILGSHNAWGWGPGRSFGNWAAAIDAVTGGLRRGYLDKGLMTPEQIVRRYAPGSDGNDEGNWSSTVSQFMRELGATVPLAPKKVAPDTAAPAEVAPPQLAPPAGPDLTAFGMANLAEIARSGKLNALDMLSRLSTTLSSPEATQTLSGAADQGTVKPRAESLTETKQRSSPLKQKAISVAVAQLGKPYVWGAETPGEGGFDCSGLIEYAYEQAGIKTPGRLTTYSAMKLGRSVKGKQLQPGDWVISNGGKHMTMYVGNGQVIAAPHRGEVVQYQPLSRFKGDIVDIRRYP